MKDSEHFDLSEIKLENFGNLDNSNLTNIVVGINYILIQFSI